MKEVIISLRNVTFGYPESEQLLSDFSLEIYKSDFMGIIGPNGAGKTTLFRILSGFLRTQQGEVSIAGHKIKHINNLSRSKYMAVVPQSVFASMPYTVRQIVEMGRVSRISKFSGLSRGDYRYISDALDYVKMRKYSDRLFNSLSGGEKQRTVIAMALAQNPQILLLDEPTASLDIGLKVHIMGLLKKLNKERNITIVVISHDIQLAAAYCERLVLINNGKIIADGKTSTVLNSDIVSNVYSCKAEVFNRDGKFFISTESTN